MTAREFLTPSCEQGLPCEPAGVTGLFAVAARVVRFDAADPHDLAFLKTPAFIRSHQTVHPAAPVVHRVVRVGHAVKGIDVGHGGGPVAVELDPHVGEVVARGREAVEDLAQPSSDLFPSLEFAPVVSDAVFRKTGGRPFRVVGVVCSRQPMKPWRVAINDRDVQDVAPGLGIPILTLDEMAESKPWK